LLYKKPILIPPFFPSINRPYNNLTVSDTKKKKDFGDALSIGDVVTYSFSEEIPGKKKGRFPINPRIIRKRVDVTWEEVVANNK
jgi:hypothetical protein